MHLHTFAQYANFLYAYFAYIVLVIVLHNAVHLTGSSISKLTNNRISPFTFIA